MNANNNNSTENEKLDFKRILPVFIIVLIDLLGLTIIIPLMPLYAASYGANASTIGLLGAAYPIMQVVGAPILGRLSDRFGRKPILLISQLGTLLGFILLGLANSIWLLFAARLLDGLSGGNLSTAQAIISDSTTEKTRTQGLGLIGAAFGIGFVFGPVIAFVSLAASGNNFHIPAFVAAGFSLLSILLTAFLLKETRSPDRQVSLTSRKEFTFKLLFATLRKPFVGLLLTMLFVYQIAFGSFQQLLSLFTLNRLGLNASGNSVIFVWVGIVIVAVQGYFIGKWSRKFGEIKLIRFGLVFLTIGFLLTSFTPRIPPPWYSQKTVSAELTGTRNLPGETPPTQHLKIDLPSDQNKGWFGIGWLLLAMIPAAIGGGVLQPSINSLLTRRVAVAEIGGTLGISAALLSAANSIAPVLGGALFQKFGSGSPYLFGALLTTILLVISFRGLHNPAPDLET
jgi:MFS transporter, DHA1 family, tetracycline resistance protein